MMVLAFQTDSTRIATFMFANEGSNRSYPDIDVPEGHHALSHHGNDPTKLAKISKINRYHVELLGYLLDAAQGASARADGTLLDQLDDRLRQRPRATATATTTTTCRSCWPAAAAAPSARAAAPLSQETPLANLYLAMLDRMGVKADAVRRQQSPLEGLT